MLSTFSGLQTYPNILFFQFDTPTNIRSLPYCLSLFDLVIWIMFYSLLWECNSGLDLKTTYTEHHVGWRSFARSCFWKGLRERVVSFFFFCQVNGESPIREWKLKKFAYAVISGRLLTTCNKGSETTLWSSLSEKSCLTTAYFSCYLFCLLYIRIKKCWTNSCYYTIILGFLRHLTI